MTNSAKAVAQRRWWSGVDRTQTSVPLAEPVERKPDLVERVTRMRKLQGEIVQHQCAIARLESDLDDERRAMVADLDMLNRELQFTNLRDPE